MSDKRKKKDKTTSDGAVGDIEVKLGEDNFTELESVVEGVEDVGGYEVDGELKSIFENEEESNNGENEILNKQVLPSQEENKQPEQEVENKVEEKNKVEETEEDWHFSGGEYNPYAVSDALKNLIIVVVFGALIGAGILYLYSTDFVKQNPISERTVGIIIIVVALFIGVVASYFVMKMMKATYERMGW